MHIYKNIDINALVAAFILLLFFSLTIRAKTSYANPLKVTRLFPKTVKSCKSATNSMIPLFSELLSYSYDFDNYQDRILHKKHNKAPNKNYLKSTAKSHKSKFLIAYEKIANYSSYHCSDLRILRKIIKNSKFIRNNHSNKIAILLPDNSFSTYSTKSQLVISSFNQAIKMICEDHQCNNSNKIKIYYINNLNEHSVKKTISELIINQGVSLIIGGYSASVANLLNQVAYSFHTPVFLLDHHNIKNLSAHTFILKPSDRILAKKILATVAKSKTKKLAMLRSIEHSHNLYDYIEKNAKKYNVQIDGIYKYNSSDYNSMLQASKNLLNLDPYLRQVEYTRLLATQKQLSQEKGLEFDPDKFSLPPQINFDYVLLSDNTKVLIHFLKIFQYLRLTTAPNLIGTYLWRTKELIEPWDPLLENARFYDFVDNYLKIPAFFYENFNTNKTNYESYLQNHIKNINNINRTDNDNLLTNQIKYNITHDGMFIDSSVAAQLDYLMIAYNALNIATNLFYFHPMKKSSFASQFRSLYFTNHENIMIKAFIHRNYVNWNSYEFILSNKNIIQKKF